LLSREIRRGDTIRIDPKTWETAIVGNSAGNAEQN